jgi:hypothetical protein
LHVRAIPEKELDFPKIQDGDTDRERVGNRCSDPPPWGPLASAEKIKLIN